MTSTKNIVCARKPQAAGTAAEARLFQATPRPKPTVFCMTLLSRPRGPEVGTAHVKAAITHVAATFNPARPTPEYAVKCPKYPIKAPEKMGDGKNSTATAKEAAQA